MDDNQAVDALLQAADHISIARHKPGQIKLHFRLSGLKRLRELDLGRVLNSFPGVRKVEKRYLFGNVVIHYDPESLPPDLWDSLGRIGRNPAEKELLRERLLQVMKKA